MTISTEHCPPDDWSAATLDQICALRQEQVDPSTSNSTVYVGLEHIESGNPTLIAHGSPSDVNSTKSRFHVGDLLYGKLRPYLDKAVLARCEGICSTDILVLTPNTDFSVGNFVISLLHTTPFVQHAIRTTHGVNHPRTSWQSIREYEFFLPPLAEQREIANVLETVHSAATAQQAVIDHIVELRAALMMKLFTEGTRGEPCKGTAIHTMPESWAVDRIGDRARIASGGTPSRNNPAFWHTGTIPWVKTGEVDYCIITSTEEHITKAGLESSSARLFPPGTLLIAMYGQGITRGKVAILGVEAATNQACGAILHDDTLLTKYLYHYMAFSYDRLRTHSHGAQQRNLSGEIVANFEIAIPSLQEQHEIVDAMNAVDATYTAAMRQKRLCKELFCAMLDELMTGHIRVGNVSQSETLRTNK